MAEQLKSIHDEHITSNMTSKLENQRVLIDQQTKVKRTTPLILQPNVNTGRPTSGHRKNQPETKPSLKESGLLMSTVSDYSQGPTSDLEIGAGEPAETNANLAIKPGLRYPVDVTGSVPIRNGGDDFLTTLEDLNPSSSEGDCTLPAVNISQNREHHENIDLESVFIPETQARKMSQPSMFLPELQVQTESQPSKLEDASQDYSENTIETYVEDLPPTENVEDSLQKVETKKKRSKRKKERRQKQGIVNESQHLDQVENDDNNQQVSSATAQVPSLVITDVQDFIMRPAPQGVTIRCRVTREKSGIDRNIYPTYFLHFEQDGEKMIFLLGSRKRKKSTTPNYVISTDPSDLSRNGKSYCGKLRSNLLGTQFTLFGCGGNPKKSGHDNIRQELAAVVYESNILGLKGPRKMTVITPKIKSEGDRIDIKPHGAHEGFIERWKRKDTNDLVGFHNKAPVWNEETQTHTLIFNGRATQASVKNFQIINNNDVDYIIMQLGKLSENVFSMDYNYPLCALQAFGIALSSFDVKLACE